MIVVSNTSPIINLAAIGRLELLQHLYGTIAIPQAVYHEIAVRGSGQPGAIEIQTSTWFERRHVRDAALVQRLKQHLDAGESEAIALAIEMQADQLLLDERRGRMIAKQQGVRVMGLLGVLLVAKRQGLLETVRPVLYDLRAVAGFWIDPELFTQVLESAGERL
jgi:predicted nucleic acid-binding protein